MNSLSSHSHALRKICIALSLVWSTGGAVASTLEKSYTATISVDWESICDISDITSSIIHELAFRGARVYELSSCFEFPSLSDSRIQPDKENYEDIYDKHTGELLYRIFLDMSTGRFWILLPKEIMNKNGGRGRRINNDM